MKVKRANAKYVPVRMDQDLVTCIDKDIQQAARRFIRKSRSGIIEEIVAKYYYFQARRTRKGGSS